MRELDIRRILAQVCRELDLRTAARRSAASAALGASLVVNVACSDDPGLKDDADASVADSGSNGSGPRSDAAAPGSGGAATREDAGAVAVYSAPAPDASAGRDAGTPFDAGPVTKYMAPDVDAAPAQDAGTLDSGAIAWYQAPVVDSGPVAEYMAQPVDDAGSVRPVDAGIEPLYMAVQTG